NEERFRKVAGIAPVAVFETDASGVCTYVNARWCEFSGDHDDGALGTLWTEAAHPDDRARLGQEWARALERSERFKSELRFLRPDAGSTSVYCEAAPILDEAGATAGWIGSAMDVTAELALREGLRDSEARFRLLVEHSPDIVVRINLRPWRIDYVSPSILDLTGRRPQEFYADAGLIITLIHPDDLTLITDPSTLPSRNDEFECRVLHGDGSTRTVEVRRHVVTVAGSPTAVEATIRDVTTDIAAQRRLDDLAHRDELTGLPNRRALMAALDSRLAAHQPTSVIFLDLDGFKLVNDTHGHDVGDKLLAAFAERLVGAVREGDFVARLGGDEFVVVARPDHSEGLARRVVEDLARPFLLAGLEAAVGVSAGVTNFDSTGPLQQSEGLLHQADQAMYEAKRRGKGQVVTTAGPRPE
ncbi:MAG: diguanylate cyclase, partial [Ilumatobacteraceae bacterium]